MSWRPACTARPTPLFSVLRGPRARIHPAWVGGGFGSTCRAGRPLLALEEERGPWKQPAPAGGGGVPRRQHCSLHVKNQMHLNPFPTPESRMVLLTMMLAGKSF